MTAAILFVAGRIVWRAERKQTKSGKAMRSVLIVTDDENVPPVRTLVFGQDAKHAEVGDFISVEGPPQVSTYERNGEIKPAVSPMARWSKLSGLGGQRQRKSEAGKKRVEKRKGDGHQAVVDFQSSADGPPGTRFDDPIGF